MRRLVSINIFLVYGESAVEVEVVEAKLSAQLLEFLASIPANFRGSTVERRIQMQLEAGLKEILFGR